MEPVVGCYIYTSQYYFTMRLVVGARVGAKVHQTIKTDFPTIPTNDLFRTSYDYVQSLREVPHFGVVGKK
jgi:hypothetical protein